MNNTDKSILIITILLFVVFLMRSFFNGDLSSFPLRFYQNLGLTIFEILLIAVILKVGSYFVSLWVNHKEKFEEKVRREMDERFKKL